MILISLEVMGIKEFWCNMLRGIALHIAHMHPCNGSNLILIDNDEGVDNTLIT
jgi:hypothetical protein